MFEKKTGKEVGGEIGLGVLRVKEGEGLPWWSIGRLPMHETWVGSILRWRDYPRLYVGPNAITRKCDFFFN